MRILTQNVKSLPLMSQDKVVHDVQLTASQADIIGWQEIQPSRYQRAVDALEDFATQYATKDGERVGGVPISWRKDRFELVDSGTEYLHGAIPGICRARYIAWVILRKKDSVHEFLVHNTHYAARRLGTPLAIGARRLQAEGRKNHLAFLAKMAKRGLPMAGLGDFNNTTCPIAERVDKRIVRLAVDRPSIDWIVFHDGADLPWWVLGHETVRDRFSDHQGRRARAVLRSK